jgi:hypothetical protein
MTHNTYEIFFTIIRPDGSRAEHMLVEEAPSLAQARVQVLLKIPEAVNIQGQLLE